MLEELAVELRLQILASAGPHAAVVYASCNRAARRLLKDHDATLFKPVAVARPFLSSPLPPPESEAEALTRNVKIAAAFKGCLQLQSWRDVWEITTRVTRLPCLGIFLAPPPDAVTSLDDLRGSYVHVMLDPDRNALHAHGLVPGTRPPQLDALNRLRVWKDRGVWGVLSHPGVPYKIGDLYRPLSVPPLPAAEIPMDPVLRGLQGLWTGIYGPHGRELVHARFIRTGSEEEEKATEEAEPDQGGSSSGTGSRVLLEGLKITGDPNVPAGKWSFRADLHRPRDLRDALQADPRPIYTSTPTAHALVDVEGEARAQRVHGLYPGRGQINMVPGNWRPETVGVDLVVFCDGDSEEEGCSRMGIIWHDEDHPVKHCIMLQRYHSGKDEDLMFGRGYMDAADAPRGLGL